MWFTICRVKECDVVSDDSNEVYHILQLVKHGVLFIRAVDIVNVVIIGFWLILDDVISVFELVLHGFEFGNKFVNFAFKERFDFFLETEFHEYRDYHQVPNLLLVFLVILKLPHN